MISSTRHVLVWAAGGLLLIGASAQPASAAPPVAPNRTKVRPAYRPANTLPERRPAPEPSNRRGLMPGWDWWRTYPWSPYNAWKNPYWYPPYNGNYPYPPGAVYPDYPYPVPPPVPLPPVQLPPAPPPLPGGAALGSGHR